MCLPEFRKFPAVLFLVRRIRDYIYHLLYDELSEGFIVKVQNT